MKAVIAAAGHSTRFLPVAKNIPKQILPLIDVPIIHEIVKECIDSGIKDIIIVTKHGDNAIEEYFGNNEDLEQFLRKENKIDRYERFMEVYDKADIAYVKQSKNLPYGNASPALAAKPFLTAGEPFAYFYADDVVLSNEPAIKQIIDRYNAIGAVDKNIGGVVAATEVEKDKLPKLSSFKFKNIDTKLVDRLIEKPAPGEESSNFAAYGRFVLDYQIFDFLKDEYVRANELWLSDAIDKLAQVKNVYAHVVDGIWSTTGDPMNYLKTLIMYALRRDDIKDELMQFILSYCRRT